MEHKNFYLLKDSNQIVKEKTENWEQILSHTHTCVYIYVGGYVYMCVCVYLMNDLYPDFIKNLQLIKRTTQYKKVRKKVEFYVM